MYVCVFCFLKGLPKYHELRALSFVVMNHCSSGTSEFLISSAQISQFLIGDRDRTTLTWTPGGSCVLNE